MTFSISLTEKELEQIRSMIGSEITSYYDENEKENEYTKRLSKIDQKLVKSVNKKGLFYNYQLDENKEVKKEYIIR